MDAITCKHVPPFILGSSHGLIRHRLSTEKLEVLCAEVAFAFAQSSIAFVASSEFAARRLRATLNLWFTDVTLALADRCEQPGAR